MLSVSVIGHFTLPTPVNDTYIPSKTSGYSVGYDTDTTVQDGNTRFNLETAVAVNTEIGYSFAITNAAVLKSFSVLADIAYYMQNFGVQYNITDGGVFVDQFYFHTLSLGTMFRFNFVRSVPDIPASFGIGYGVRIPFSANRTIVNSGDKEKLNLSYNNIRSLFFNDVILYGKMAFDVYYYFTKNFAFSHGVYITYNHGMQYYNTVTGYSKHGYSSIDLGISVSLYFGRENPNKKS